MAKKLSDMDDDFFVDEDEEEVNQEKKKINIKAVIIAFFLVGVAVAVFILCAKTVFKDFNLKREAKASKKHVDLKTVFEIKEGSYPLICDGVLSEYRAYEMEGVLYLNRKIVVSEIDCRFYFDEKNDKVLYTTENNTYTFVPGSKEYSDIFGNVTTLDYVPVMENANGIYIALDFINFKRTMFTYEVFEEPRRVALWTYKKENGFDNYVLTQSTAIREGDSITKDILADGKKGEYVTVTEEPDGDFYKVCYHGIAGYVKKDCIESATPAQGFFVLNPEFKRIRENSYISLGWAQVTSLSANAGIVDNAAAAKGINVISPTWYQVENTKGDLASFADRDIVSELHRMGLKVWPLISDFVIDVNSKELLSGTGSRKNMIDKLLTDAKTYGYDGINVDFEHVTSESAEDYLQFLRELSLECRKEGITLSADTYVPMAHTAFYNREELGKVLDYVIVMTYDEHWAGAPESGSVSSLPFVESGIKNTVKEVGDATKVVVGLPFYTRIWAEDATSGTVKITSSAYGIKSVMDVIGEYSEQKQWLADVGQYFVQYEKDGVVYKCWIEDNASMEEKLRAAKDANIAGIAFWRLGFEGSDIYDVINKYR